jgi:hypothetical protein
MWLRFVAGIKQDCRPWRLVYRTQGVVVAYCMEYMLRMSSTCLRGTGSRTGLPVAHRFGGLKVLDVIFSTWTSIGANVFDYHCTEQKKSIAAITRSTPPASPSSVTTWQVLVMYNYIHAYLFQLQLRHSTMRSRPRPGYDRTTDLHWPGQIRTSHMSS